MAMTYMDSAGKLRTVSTANPLPTTGGGGGGGTTVLPAGADRSGSIATAGTAQDVAAQNTARQGLTFQNTSDTDMRLTENGVTATATTGFLVKPGSGVNVSTNRRISVWCASAGKTFAATEI